ncbi:MAG: hypothetical protein P4M08_00095 [Oligoflexia bacterium]|nr:hypothetical protein [Oligoflexia bacterium]
MTGATGASPWSLNGSNAYYSAGNVGVGTTSPGVTMDVNGGVRAGTSTSVTTCGSGQANGEGTQRYNYTTHNMEYCNGTTWISVVANNRFQGSLIMAGKSGCSWSMSGSTWTTFSTPTSSCNTATVTGNASIPSEGKIPGIAFASLPAGTYTVVLSLDSMYETDSNDYGCVFRITDGTNYSGVTDANYYSEASQISAVFTYATAQTNIEFKLQAVGYNSSATCQANINTSGIDQMQLWVEQL